MAEPQAVTIRVTGFPQEMVGDPFTIDETWVPFFSSADYPLRIIARTTRFDLRQPIQRLRGIRQQLDAERTVLRALERILAAWDDPAALRGCLELLPADARAPFADALASAAPPPPQPTPGGWAIRATSNGTVGTVHANGHTAVATLPELGAPDLLAAYLEHLAAPMQALVVEQLADPDAARDPQAWREVVAALNVRQWRRRWVQSYRQMYANLESALALRSLRHDVIAWPGDGLRPEDYAGMLGRAFGTAARVDMLPNLLPGRYQERPLYLEPQEPYHPLVTFLTPSGPLKGQWDTTVIHRLLNLDIDLALCLDVQPVSRTHMEFQADQTVTDRSQQFSMGRGPRDARAEREYSTALDMQHGLNTMAPHDLRLVVAVFGGDINELTVNANGVKQAGGTRMNLLRMPHHQAPLRKFFTDTPTPRIDSQTRPHRMLSDGIAVTVPFGLRKPDRTDGILWMFQGGTPIMFDPIANRQAGHAVVLGKTGSGKTYALSTWALRWLNEGHQVVMYEPQGHSRRLVAAAGAGGARYVLDPRQRINVLDVVTGRGELGEPPALSTQIAHVQTQLSVLLGRSTVAADGSNVFAAHEWTRDEKSMMDLALQELYEPWADNLDDLRLADTPTIADLCDLLADLGEPEAKTMARTLELALVKSASGQMFNATTSIDWRFEADCTAYDFSQIADPVLQIFYYGQAFGALNRYVRSPQRSRSRPLWAIIDEFKFMASVPSLASFAALASKTWRTFGAALWTADQDAHTYLGTEQSAPDGSMLSVWLNSTLKIVFRQDQADAKRIQQKIQGMQPMHADLITRLSRGDVVMVWESDDPNLVYNEVFVGRVEANDAEHREFAGS